MLSFGKHRKKTRGKEGVKKNIVTAAGTWKAGGGDCRHLKGGAGG